MMRLRSKLLLKDLGRRYAIVLAVVAALLIADQLLLQPMLIHLNGFGPVINLSGRQRMLSQRITKALLAISRDPDQLEPWHSELRESLLVWERVQRGLQQGDSELHLPETTDREILAAFANLELHYMEVLGTARSILQEPTRSQELVLRVLEHERPYLEGMDQIVSMFEQRARQKIQQLRILGMTATVTVLLLMAGLARMILKPASDLIHEQLSKLAGSEERFRLLIESMHDGLAIFNTGGQLRYVNRRFAQILDRDPDGLMGESLSALTSGLHLEQLQKLIRKAPLAGSGVSEISWFSPTGKECQTLTACGQTAGTEHSEQFDFLIVTDISALKAAESALRAAHDELERRVTERTQELSAANISLAREVVERELVEERNRQIQAELAHASRITSLGQFATGLAHEINQPLGAISMYAEAIMVMVDQPEKNAIELRHTAVRLRDAALRAGQIVGRMRNFLKTRSGHRSAELINPLMEEVLGICSPDINLRKVRVVYDDHATKDVSVLVDSIQIQQVLVNLIGNATQAMCDQVADRQLTIRSSLDDDHSVLVTVEDTGPGFSSEWLESSRGPFQTTKEHGLGMGLSISQSLIAAHGGELRIENLIPRGARVCISLPVTAPLQDAINYVPDCVCG